MHLKGHLIHALQQLLIHFHFKCTSYFLFQEMARELIQMSLYNVGTLLDPIQIITIPFEIDNKCMIRKSESYFDISARA